MTPAEEAELAAARTPAEAKRHWMIDRLWIASLLSLAGLSALVGIIWLGGWADRLQPFQLKLLGAIALLLIARMIVVDLSFSLGGPVGRWKARWGDREFSADDDDAVRGSYDGRAP